MSEEKDILSFATKLGEKYLILVIPKNTINLNRRKKHKIGQAIKNNCSSTKNLRKSKNC